LLNLKDVLPEVVFDELWERYQADPVAFIEEWEQLAHEMQKGFIQHARQRLTSLTRLQQAGNGHAPAWKSIQRALDSRQNDLLRAAVAAEFLDLVEPAVARATHLRECVVAPPSSDEADRYLDEATRCYFYALFTACAVMCRSVLEEAIKQKLPESLRKLIRSRYRNAATLGNLLHEINNNLSPPASIPPSRASPTRSTTSAKKPFTRACSQKTKPAAACKTPATALQMLLQLSYVNRRIFYVKCRLVPDSGSDQILDCLQSLDSAACSGCGAVESSCGAGKIELAAERPALQQTVDKSGVENISGSSGVHHGNPVGGGVVELAAVPGENAVLAEGRRGEHGAEAMMHLAKSGFEVRLLHEAAGKVAADNRVVDLFEQRFDAGIKLIEIGDYGNAGFASVGLAAAD
jgi:hypothetical protein